jgi:threonine synthase
LPSIFRCIECGRRYAPGSTLRCECGGLLEVEHEFVDIDRELFDGRLGSRDHPYTSGVWRFKEMVYPDIPNRQIISRPEGNTNLYGRRRVTEYVGAKNLGLKHEGENPSGSFKDRGMTVGISEAKRLNAGAVACASTGNTSASLAAYAAQADIGCVVFVPEGEIAFGKLSQALAYGAKVLQVRGNFDDAMRIVQQASDALGLYLLNSVNPWRIEGQKTILCELMQQRRWKPPGWVVLPAGNLGNTSAFGKALSEMRHLGLIDEVPRLAAIQAEGANPFYQLWKSGKRKLTPIENAETVASAIRIGAPVSWRKALDAIKTVGGVVEHVSDQEIMDAKAVVDASGIGCEPASAASVAGTKKLIEAGVIDPNEEIVCILTGNLLKDPDSTIQYHKGSLKDINPRFANGPMTIEPELSSVEESLHELGFDEPVVR